MHVCGTVVKQFGTVLNWLFKSVELDLNLLVVLWTCVQLRLSSFSVVRALSLCLVLQCLWTLLELVDLHGKVLQTLATGFGGFSKWYTGDALAVSWMMLHGQHCSATNGWSLTPVLRYQCGP